MLSNKDIFDIATAQSAVDLGASKSDFSLSENRVYLSSGLNPHAKKYYKSPVCCNLVSYGTNIVASADSVCYNTVKDYVDRFVCCHCFETPNIHVLDKALEPIGRRVCFMAEYWLPDVNAVTSSDCGFVLRELEHEDFAELYLPEWSNALCSERKALDVMGVGAYDGGKLVGLAGCSADCDGMYQIGIDVLPEYRRQGIASALTGKLAQMILDCGKVPFYCCAWSNIASARNAFRSGFRPAWAEMTVKPTEFVTEMNEENPE